MFDSTLGRQTCSPVFSPVIVGNPKGRRGDRAKDSVQQSQRFCNEYDCICFFGFVFPFLSLLLFSFLRKLNKKWICFEENDERIT